MRFYYVSPSTLPSRSANSVHVIWQCDGLVRAGADVTLFAKRAMPDSSVLPSEVQTAYGVDASAMRLATCYNPSSRGDNLRIAALALKAIKQGARPDAILSRNLYAAFVLAILQKKPLLFETHQLERGIRKTMQRAVMTRPWVTTIAISDHLIEYLARHHGATPFRPLVLHDAAPDGILPIDAADRRRILVTLAPSAKGKWDLVCGYFGHLYPGRGVEIIEAMAAARPRCLFLVYGGNDADVIARRAVNRLANLRYIGHVPHPVARKAMCSMDVLLMPYQESVSIGVAGHDTARWMSPMKMFEYLGAGVPIISSGLPVLREVLKDGGNCLLVSPSEVIAWVAALDRLLAEPGLATALGENAHTQYLRHHTWTRRAERILTAARDL